MTLSSITLGLLAAALGSAWYDYDRKATRAR